MTEQVLAVAWYRFRATFHRRSGGYLSIVVLIAMLGGVAMASIAAARRTRASYPTFLASTNPSDLTMSVYSEGAGTAGPSLTNKIGRLPDLRHVESLLAPTVVPLTSSGAPRLDTANLVVAVGSLDGLTITQDLVFAMLDAALPGRAAARTPAAIALRTD